MIGGMTGALVWKEWRTLRGLLIANVVLCLIAPLALSAWSAAFLQDRAGDSMAVLLLSTSLFAVLPIFAAACGATVIAGERSERTIGYLLSRPMSRFRIYATKVAVALSAWLLVALCWWVTTWIVHGGPIVSVGRQMAFEFGEQWMLWVVLSFLVFCCAVMASTWLSQTMTAAAGGVAMAAVFASILYVLWGRTTLETMVGPVWLALQLLALGLMVLCVAALWFSREETHGPFGIAQRPLVLVALLVTTATVGAVPMVVRGMHVDPENLVLTVPRLSGDGSVVFADARDPGDEILGIWAIPTDGRPAHPLTPKMTSVPLFSTDNRAYDGERIFYYSARTVFGFRGDRHQLRSVRPDGSDDRGFGIDMGLVGGLSEYNPGAHSVSPDGDWLALEHSSLPKLKLISLRGGDDVQRVIDLPSSPDYTTDGLAGWASNGETIYLVGGEPGVAGASVLLIDPESGNVTKIYDDSTVRLVPLLRHSPTHSQSDGLIGNGLPLIEIGTDEFSRLVLVDVLTGKRHILSDRTRYPGLTHDRRERFVAFSEFADDERLPERSRLMVIDLKTGVSNIIGDLDARMVQLSLSPDAARIAVMELGGIRVFDTSHASEPIQIQRGVMIGWRDRHHLVVSSGINLTTVDSLDLYDVRDGTSRRIFP